MALTPTMLDEFNKLELPELVILDTLPETSNMDAFMDALLKTTNMGIRAHEKSNYAINDLLEYFDNDTVTPPSVSKETTIVQKSSEVGVSQSTASSLPRQLGLSTSLNIILYNRLDQLESRYLYNVSPFKTYLLAILKGSVILLNLTSEEQTAFVYVYAALASAPIYNHIDFNSQVTTMTYLFTTNTLSVKPENIWLENLVEFRNSSNEILQLCKSIGCFPVIFTGALINYINTVVRSFEKNITNPTIKEILGTLVHHYPI